MTFLLNAKNLAFTYSQCPLHPEFVRDHLQALFADKKPLYIQVSREHHAGGQFHLHALVCLAGKFKTTNARVADIEEEGTTYHPNFKKSWNVQGWKQYLEKEHFLSSATGAWESVSVRGRPPKEKIHEKIAAKIDKGKTIGQLIQKRKLQGYLLTNLAKVQHFATVLQMFKTEEMIPWPRLRSSLTTQNSRILLAEK